MHLLYFLFWGRLRERPKKPVILEAPNKISSSSPTGDVGMRVYLFICFVLFCFVMKRDWQNSDGSKRVKNVSSFSWW